MKVAKKEMTNTLGNFNPRLKWEHVAKELGQYCEAQQRDWGTIDAITLGRYLAGEATPEETALVESAMEAHPKLKEVVRLVRQVLDPE